MKITILMGWIALLGAAGAANAESSAEAKPDVYFNLLENKADNTFRAAIKLENTSQEPMKQWTLHFSFVRPIVNLKGGRIVEGPERNGDFFSIEADEAGQTLEPGQQIAMELIGKWFLKHETDAPAGFFISYRDRAGQTKVRQLKLRSHIDPGTRAPAPTETVRLQPTSMPIVPLPVQYEIKKGSGFALQKTTPIVHDPKAPGAREAAQFLREILQPLVGGTLPLLEKNAQQASIRFIHARMKFAEAYELSINRQEITIKAADPAGFHYAVQSLRQLLPLKPQENLRLMPITIQDHPRYSWRGLHLDVARNFHSTEDVKRLLDLMAMHKLNRFHWHLTDDEGWRLVINAYPQLTTIGAFRGFGLPLAPALGSGPDRQGGFYTQDEIREVVAYAKARQITIIPEIDMPGHARAMLKSLPQLVDPQDRSVYESVQAYRDNVLSPCLPATYEVVDTILGEVATLFPGPYIHVGGDEVPDGVWNPEHSPRCKQLMSREGLQNKQDLENYFFKKIQSSVTKYGKKMAGWEEIVAGKGFPRRDVLVFAWKSSKDSERLVKEGHPVVLNPADHLYFDLAYNEDPREPGYYWAGTIDTQKVYAYPGSEQKNVQGVQGNLWSETIRTRQDLDYRAFPRVVALAEIAWTPLKKQSWPNFSQRLTQWHLPRLEAYGVQYRVSPGMSKLTSQP